jgi:segregation and condensation protein B
MAFNLKKVLKALLLSTSQPLAIKDIQTVFTRFHETAEAEREAQEEAPAASEAAPGAPAVESTADASATAVATAEPVAAVETPDLALQPAEDPELYSEVPSLITATQIREAMDQIAAELRAADEGLLLIEGSNGYRIATHPRFARWVRILRDEPAPLKLNQSSVETLAIIAYRQPVTRGEIETIRGVSAEAGVNKLLERELVYVVGRADLPGRPIQYGTTDKFLEFVGVKSLDELPASDVLSSRQVDEWLKTAMNPPSLGDTDMGLANEELPLEGDATAAAAPADAAPEGATQESAPAPATAEAVEPSAEAPASEETPSRTDENPNPA